MRPLLLALLLPACAHHREVRARIVPDPVPLCEEDGMAHYLIELQSLSRRDFRVQGQRLPAGGRLVVEGSTRPHAQDPRAEARIALNDDWGATIAELVIPFRVTRGRRLTDLDFPLPDLGGHEIRITAGFHAPNHRQPGRRYAVDLVPVLPEGGDPIGVEVRSPFAAKILAFTEEAPDRPSAEPNEILLRDAKGRIWRYAHFQKGSIPLSLGQEIEKGALLGRLGLSGRTTGPHLHVELVSPLD